MNSDRNQVDYNSLVGYDADGNAVILDYTFGYPGGLHGATGSVVELVSQQQYDFQTARENLTECYEDLWREEAGNTNGTTKSLDEWVEDVEDDLIEMLYDESGYDIPGNHVATNIIGCGRIFPGAIDDLVTIVNPELVDVIRRAEEGNLS